MKNLAELPDYPVIEQLQNALWQAGEIRGAAVMVGAGFSRFAALPAEDAQPAPLWPDFSREMSRALGYAADRIMDPLKLAQEYEAALGKTALEGLIRSLVRDGEWLPSSQHERLLGLPWADVLTTNWDTLLERTAVDPDGPHYQVVRTVADIARTRSPRIVKLHGSLPSHKPFIFTEEDFRTYPQHFAPFVNTAQQILLENELCLVGFSGDDPNFIRWSGWVRDQLGASARRVHLVGVLNLTQSRRRVLEQQNVSVVDLAPAVEDEEPADRHRIATDAFLNALWAGKPRARHVWTRQNRSPSATGAPTAAQIETLAEDWKSDRKSYPGWLVAPHHERARLRHETDGDYRVLLEAMANSNDERALGEMLFEALWRYEASLWPLDESIEKVAAKFFETSIRGGLGRPEQVQMLAFLTSEARHRRDYEAFDRWIAKLEDFDTSEAVASGSYQRALRARDQFDFGSISELVPKIVGTDPIWSARRAKVHIDLGETRKGAQLINEAFVAIQERRRADPQSIWLLSRQAWMHWLWRSTWWELKEEGDAFPEEAEWPIRYTANKSDPWDDLHDFDVQLQRDLAELRKESVDSRSRKFDPGIYTKPHAGTRFISHTVVKTADELSRLSDKVGLPHSLGSMDVIGGRLATALELDQRADPATTWLAARSIRNKSGGLIDERFGRASLAQQPRELVRSLASSMQNAIAFGMEAMGAQGDERRWRSAWLDRCVRWTELLSRLVFRLSAAEAVAIWKFAVSLGQHPKWDHWWLYEPLGHLMRRALQAMAPATRATLLTDVLLFPLPAEKSGGGNERDWPECIELIERSHIVRDPVDGAIANRVQNLIHYVRSGDRLTRSRATRRLLSLHQAGALLSSEATEFAKALWVRRDPKTTLPIDLDLYDHIVLLCPEPEAGLAKKAFVSGIVEPLSQGTAVTEYLVALRYASRRRIENFCEPTIEQAVDMLGHLLAQKPRKGSGEMFDQTSFLEDDKHAAIGPCLAEAVLPALSAEQAQPQKTAWQEGLLDDSRHWLRVTAAEFARIWPPESDFAISAVRRSLASSDQSTALSGIDAVNNFRLARKDRQQTFPRVLATDIVAACENRREPGLSWSLQCARHLLEDGLLTLEDQTRLMGGLEFLISETEYRNWNSDDPRTPSVGLVRRECVRLAAALKEVGRSGRVLDAWLTQAVEDPMPEVRFALDRSNGTLNENPE